VDSAPAGQRDRFEHRQLLEELQSAMFGRGEELRVGRYRVRRRIDGGAMGTVYIAEDARLDRAVAIKLLHEDLYGERPEVGRQRLRREARALGRISHPNVVGIYDVGLFEDRVFIAMELVRGQTLAHWLEEKRRTWSEILAAFVQAGRGLQAAHEVGVVHREFKPSNVVVGDDGRVRVLDFGLARSSRSSRATDSGFVGNERPVEGDLSTQGGALAGTPHFMAPEQLQGDRANPASDQYAFCVAVFEALFEAPPFDPEAMLGSKLAASHVGLPARSRRLPAQIFGALRRGLSPDPGARFPTMAALLWALEVRPGRTRAVVFAGVLGAGVVGAWGFAGSGATSPGTQQAIGGAEHQQEILPSIDALLDQARAHRESGALDQAEAVGRTALAEANEAGHCASVVRARIATAPLPTSSSFARESM
jgi:predicted Ser/Thr protein kinase